MLGYICAIVLPPRLGIAALWGTAGLTASAGVSGWIEFLLLRRTLNKRLGPTGLPASLTARLWLAALAGAGVAWAIKVVLPFQQPILVAASVLIPYGLVYLGLTLWLKIPVGFLVLGGVIRWYALLVMGWAIPPRLVMLPEEVTNASV